jgi:hypothetical protein
MYGHLTITIWLSSSFLLHDVVFYGLNTFGKRDGNDRFSLKTKSLKTKWRIKGSQGRRDDQAYNLTRLAKVFKHHDLPFIQHYYEQNMS